MKCHRFLMFCEVHYNMKPTPPQNKQGRNEGFNSRVRQIVNSIKVPLSVRDKDLVIRDKESIQHFQV